MQYRPFGKLDWRGSALGFGCMRLPFVGEFANIDEPLGTRMLHYAIEQGVNYVDTAYPYHDGNSERFLGRALQNGYREKVKLATKMPSWAIKSPADFDRYLAEQLARLQTDHIDFYLLHALDKERWPNLYRLGVLEWAERALADGRIGGLGFSFHDQYPVFQEIVDAYDGWALCQIQYNYMDIANQAGTRGLKYAASKGLAVVVMEPVQGGKLVNPPRPVQEIWDTTARKRTSADWAFQWVWNQAEVAVVLSGMRTMQQVEENVASAAASGVGTLTTEELAVVDQVRAAYQGLCLIPCTGCGYCMPCPKGVDIPMNLGAYNDGWMYNKADGARGSYAWMLEGYQKGIYPTDKRAVNCAECQECEGKCPQSIPVSRWMPIVHQVLGEGKSYEECPLSQRS